MNDYEKQAADFMAATDTALKVDFLRLGWMDWDDKKNPPRAIYRFTLTRGSRSYSAEFGQSYQRSAVYLLRGDYRKGQTMKRGATGEPRAWTREFGTHGALTRFSDWERNKYYSEPTAYDILSCLDGYCADTFEEFCADYGYDTDSRSAERTYNAMREQVNGLRALYSDSEIDQLAEIN